jgi:hypothetical protein
MRIGLIKRRIFPWVVLVGLVAVGLPGCIVVPVPVPGHGNYAPGYGAPPPAYGVPAPGWGPGWRHRHWR